MSLSRGQLMLKLVKDSKLVPKVTVSVSDPDTDRTCIVPDSNDILLLGNEQSLDVASRTPISDDSEPEFLSDDSYKPSELDSSTTDESNDEVLFPAHNNRKINNDTIELDNDPVKKRKRRKAKPEEWKRNIVKRKRLSGQQYKNRGGKVIPEKSPKSQDCSNCRYKCNSNFEEDLRMKICKEYWALADSDKQKIYLTSLIQNVPVNRRNIKANKHRSTSRIFFLMDNDGQKKRVCLKFFCCTFAITHRVVERCMRDVGISGLYMGTDKRAGKIPTNITPEVDINFVKKHIDSFPKMESHYCRRDSRKLYLHSDLNLSLMYRLYKELCTSENMKPVSEFVYRKIFHEFEPPLSFYIPKKDQCPLCNSYNEATDKTLLETEWKKHKKREIESMEMKSRDKIKAKNDNGISFRAITFDLQAILSVPFSGENQLYYRRKLNVYNFTIFDSYNNSGYCFVWDECASSKGSSEIGTCVLKYLLNLPETVTHVSTFSDTCGGQNRKKFFSAAMLYAVNNIPHLEIIDVKYMESGHSYLEADSIHATIERARKHKKIYTTREWSLLISSARKKPKPYDVITLIFSDFHNLHDLTENMVRNTTINTKNERVQWLKIKWLRFEKTKPWSILYKYDLSAEHFFEIDINQKRGVERKDWSSITLKQKYLKMLPVTEEKKKDLLFLLQSRIIPPDYKYFIDAIPSTSRQRKNNIQNEENEDSE